MNPALLQKIMAHLRQPTTIAGIAWLINTGLSVYLGHCDGTHALPSLAGSLALIVMQDSTGGVARAIAVATQVQQMMGPAAPPAVPADQPPA